MLFKNCITILLTILNFQVSVQALSSGTGSSSTSINTGANKLIQLCQEARKERKRNECSSIILPGIHDALSAKIFANAGAKVLFLSGFGVSASKLGQPDVGLLTQTEMEDTLRSVIQAVSSTSLIPVIVDGDTGYGGTMNIRRTIRSFASTGAAAVTIEDQMFPKKCTYAAGKGVKVVPFEECKVRIKTAIAARDEARMIDGNDILIIARTDCRAALGLEEAVARCKMFEDAGADICYAENLQSREEYEYLKDKLHPSTLTMLAQVQLTPSNKDGDSDQLLFNANEIGEMGYDLSLFGVTPLQSIVHAMKSTASAIFDPTRNSSGLINEIPLTPFSELKDVVGFPEAEHFATSQAMVEEKNTET
jgi:2-methylisocitrate lyase-like PEP mutase family enzyme